jgi:hypothetical protein
MHKRFYTLFVMLFVIVTAGIYFAGCDLEKAVVTDSSQSQITSFTKLSADDPAVMSVMAVQNKHTGDLMKDKNVVGTATGMTTDGRLAILVFLEKSASQSKDIKTISSIPDNFDGIPVIVEVTGPIKALKTTTVSHKTKQTPPIQLGTSGGWRYDLANGYCCGGTIGSLVLKGGKQYVLSNYHVLEADIVSGGNSRVATAGDPVIQPGLIDVSCTAANAQNVASLSGIKSLPSSNVDAAIAEVISGMVRTDGSILEVGTISATTVAAYVGQKVKKSGRTSGLTRTTVYALNATISVQYENECAGGVAFTKQFTGQIVFKGGKFIQSGDSGSLAVQDVTTNPKAVGLCFAGSSTYGFGNPIGQVLSYYGATMVGN